MKNKDYIYLSLCSVLYFAVFLFCLSILYVITDSSLQFIGLSAFVFSSLLAPIYSLCGYGIVLRKYKKNMQMKVNKSVKDMILLYFCKFIGCLFITAIIATALQISKENLREYFTLILLILFAVTPSVKTAVENIQTKYHHKHLTRNTGTTVTEETVEPENVC